MLMLWGPPFPLFVASWIFTGFGFALQDAQCNSLSSHFPNASTTISLLHACFGLGASISPFFATSFVERNAAHVYLYFIIPLIVALVTVSLLVIVFQGRSTEDIMPSGAEPELDDDEAAVPLVEGGKGASLEKSGVPMSSGDKFNALFNDRAVMYLVTFIIVYVSRMVVFADPLRSGTKSRLVDGQCLS